MELILNIFLIFFFIFLNGFFVLSEYALVSVRKTRIEELVNQGNKNAQTVLYALNHMPMFISATQLGITIASIALGWLGEPTLAHFFAILFPSLLSSPIFSVYSHILAIVISFLIISFLEIIFGELAPKTTALQNPEPIAFIIIFPLTLFTTIFKPFIWLLQKTSSFVLGIFHISSSAKKTNILSEEEIKMILSQSAEGGVIDQHEVDLISHVFKIGDLPIETIMTPLEKVIAFSEDSRVKEVAKEITERNIHTRFPIYRDTIENIIGYIAVIDIYELASKRDKMLNKTNLIRKILTIQEGMRIDDALVSMKKMGNHVGIVKDSQGNAVGLVSIEDIIESLVGKIKKE